VTHIEIESQTRNRAYAIWEAEGRPEGRAVDHWLAAEAECQRTPRRSARVSRPRRTSPSTADAVAIKTKTAAAASDKR
jgi:Protein of unknown function (DUF2934)